MHLAPRHIRTHLNARYQSEILKMARSLDCFLKSVRDVVIGERHNSHPSTVGEVHKVGWAENPVGEGAVSVEISDAGHLGNLPVYSLDG